MVTRKEVNETKKKDEKRGGRKNVNSFESKKKRLGVLWPTHPL